MLVFVFVFVFVFVCIPTREEHQQEEVCCLQERVKMRMDEGVERRSC